MAFSPKTSRLTSSSEASTMRPVNSKSIQTPVVPMVEVLADGTPLKGHRRLDSDDPYSSAFGLTCFLRNGAASFQMATTADVFWCQPPDNETWHIHRIFVVAVGTGSATWDKFANLTLALGWTMGLADITDVIRRDFLDGETISTNTDVMAHLGTDFDIRNFGAAPEGIDLSIKVLELFGMPLILEGKADGEREDQEPARMLVETQDDMTALNHFSVKICGWRVRHTSA